MDINRRHGAPHMFAGKEVQIKNGELKGNYYVIEDYWDRIDEKDWSDPNRRGNPACLLYSRRIAFQDFQVPRDNEVLYGKIGMMGFLVHEKELEVIPAKSKRGRS